MNGIPVFAMNPDPILKPLRETADRVGREVEEFAEKLDSWRTQTGTEPKDRRKAAFGLARDYRNIAQNAVDRLTEENEAEQRIDFANTWKQAHGTATNNPSTSRASQVGGLSSSQQGQTTLRELKRWQSELATWHLLEHLLVFTYPEPSPEKPQESKEFRGDRFEADGKPFHDFIAGDASARERLVVLKWLEDIAESTTNDVEIIEDQLEERSGRGKGLWAQGWLDTREKIKGEKRLRLWDTPVSSQLPKINNTEGTELLITQLDPDAATRQNRKLETPDSNFENSFWTLCWEMFRRGQPLENIREWCQEKNQFARAQSMGAQQIDGYKQPLSTVVNTRLRWRRTCRYAAKNGGMSAYERAIYGLMSGDVKAIEPVCTSWDDFLYANINALLLGQYEAYILKEHANLIPKNGGSSFSIDSGVILNEDALVAAKRVIKSFQLNPKSRISVVLPYKCLQSRLILHDFEDLIFQQGVALSRRVFEAHTGGSVMELIPAGPSTYLPADFKIDLIADDPDILRILTHILLIFQLLGYEYPGPNRQMASENILAAYIDVLRQARKLDLLPVYASSMSEERAEMTIARVLPAMINPGERTEYLQLIKSMKIDIYEVLTLQYEFAMDASSYEDEPHGVTPLKMLEPTNNRMWPGQRIRPPMPVSFEWEDEYIIRSMEWWPLVDGEWTIAFASLTEVAIRFLATGRLTALLALFNRLPFSVLSTAKTSAILGKQVDILQDHEGSDEDETPALQRSMKSRPTPSARTARTPLAAKELKVHRDLLKAQSRTYVEIGQMVAALKSMWRWRVIEDEYIGTAPTRADSSAARKNLRKSLDELVHDMEPILGDYLTHPQNDVEEDNLKAIREALLPEMILAYNSALHAAAHLGSREHILQSLDLANDVAENAELVRCFMASGRMGELVDAFALSSAAMLSLNEQAGNKAARKQRRGRAGQTLCIWDVVA